MKRIETYLRQDEIDVLWSAVIAQEGIERVLSQSATDSKDYNEHWNRMRVCKGLQDRIKKIGVSGI